MQALAIQCCRWIPALLLALLMKAHLEESAAAPTIIPATRAAVSDPRLNVLFVMVEDLRPEHARSHAIVPNIHRLEKMGVSFDLALAQVAVCAPSRASLLTGLRPDTLGIYDFGHFGGLRHFRTIPSHFHRLGYQTSNAGKIFHWESSWHYSSGYWGSPEWEAIQESQKALLNGSVTPDAIHDVDLDSKAKKDANGNFFVDSHISANAMGFLKSMDKRPEPWLLTIGFKGTHMPYHIPKRFWDMYSSISSDLAFQKSYNADSFKFPPTAPLIHYVTKTEETKISFMADEGRQRGGAKEYYQTQRRMSVKARDEIYRGYLASLSFMDHELGKVLDAMDALNLWQSTVVVFTSDHGMHLGEKGIWGKWTLFDESTRVPLIIHAPQFPNSFGRRFSGPVELIDIFPTLVDLSGTKLEKECPFVSTEKTVKGGTKVVKGVKIPGEGPIRNADGHVLRHAFCDTLDGKSLMPVIESLHVLANSNSRSSSNRNSDSDSFFSKIKSSVFDIVGNNNVNSNKYILEHKKFALTQRMTCKMPGTTDLGALDANWHDFCPFKKLPRDPAKGAIGYALRSKAFRYVAWLQWDTNSFLPALELPPLAEELYDHRQDQEQHQDIADSGASSGSNSNWSSVSRFNPELREMVNMASNGGSNDETKRVLRQLRMALYDHLWFNSSFEHLWQKRLQDKPNMRPIFQGRYHDEPHPHWQISKQHYYRQTSKVSL